MALYAAKKSITVTAGLRQPHATLQTGRCHITLFPVKNPSPAMRPFAKFFDHLFFSVVYGFEDWVAQVRDQGS